MIAEKLNESYAADSQARLQEQAREGWWPRASGLGGCMREMAHLAAGFAPRPISPEGARVFELGSQRGAELERRAKMIWPDAETQVEVSIPLPGVSRPLLGHLDLWIPSLRTIVDFKTAGSFKMGLLAEGKEGAGEDYEMQLHAYRHGIALQVVGPIRCLLVFESKDSDARKGVQAGQLVEVEVPWTQELEDRFQQRLMAVASIVRQKELGSLDPTLIDGMPKDHWRCRNSKDGRPLYCSIGTVAGKCHQ